MRRAFADQLLYRPIGAYFQVAQTPVEAVYMAEAAVLASLKEQAHVEATKAGTDSIGRVERMAAQDEKMPSTAVPAVKDIALPSSTAMPTPASESNSQFALNNKYAFFTGAACGALVALVATTLLSSKSRSNTIH